MKRSRPHAEFWPDLMANHWDRQPAKLKMPLEQPLITSEELFTTLLNASDSWRQGQPVEWRWWAGMGKLGFGIGRSMIRAEDNSLTGYNQRMSEFHQGQPYMVAVFELQKHAPEMWFRARVFLEELIRHLGAPALTSSLDIFMGDYPVTGSGIHRDACHGFNFIIEGEKTLLFWPREFFDDKKVRMGRNGYAVDDDVVDEFRDQAIAITASPGEMIYLPPGHWHIGSSESGFTAMYNIGLYVCAEDVPDNKLTSYNLGEFLIDTVVPDLGDLPETSSWTPVDWDHVGQGSVPLPAAEVAGLEALEHLSWEGIRKKAEIAWLNRLTSLNFWPVPPLLSRSELSLDDVVYGDPDFKILYIEDLDGQLAVSAHGHCFRVKDSDAARQMIQILNSSSKQRISALVDGRAELKGLVEELYQARAVYRVENGTSEPAAS